MKSPTADPRNRALTIPDCARLLGISVSHAYSLAAEGKLPGAFPLGRVVRVRRPVFMAWLERGEVPAEQAA